MVLTAREVPVRPAPLELARRVEGRPGFAFLWSADGSGPSYLTCDPIAERSGLDPEPELVLCARPSQNQGVPRWIGVIPYESRRGLERREFQRIEDRAPPHMREPCWLRYGAVARIDERVIVAGDDPRCVERLCEQLRTPPAPTASEAELRLESLRLPDVDPHRRRVERALDLIKNGDIYQVNLAHRIDFEWGASSLALLRALARHAPAPFSVALSWPEADVVGVSPELFLSLQPGNTLLTQPIKGTRPRGKDAISDRVLRDELNDDPKERAELSMIIDVERNDLGRICVPGSIRVPRAPQVVTHRSLHHRFADVVGRLKHGTDRTHLLEAMLPSGSVTGAPKVRAMELIAELEDARRGLYTGAFGYLSHAGTLKLAMAIRTATLVGSGARRAGHYFVGGGIVADSDPLKEVRETHLKAEQLVRLLGQNLAAPALRR